MFICEAYIAELFDSEKRVIQKSRLDVSTE